MTADTTSLSLAVLSSHSVPSGEVNDDRIGHKANVAWVIDGATDIGDGPLVSESSDAAWLAETIGAWLEAQAEKLPESLSELLAPLSDHTAGQFKHLARRNPSGRHEYPSASGMIVRLGGEHLDYLSVGDCSLLVGRAGEGVVRHGVDENDAGDSWLAEQIQELQDDPDSRSASGIRTQIMPILRAARARLNEPDGYGVFSIVQPPPAFINTGTIPVGQGDRILLASDGFMRLVDVYQRCTASELLIRTFERGAEAVLTQLREIEAEDTDCQRFPRAKPRDDASTIIAEIRSTG